MTDWVSLHVLEQFATDPRDVRSLADVKAIAAADPDADIVGLINAALARGRASRGNAPKKALAILDLLTNLMREIERGSGLSRMFSGVSRESCEFRRLWIITRVPCPDCKVGHLRILRKRYRSGKVYRFAGCTQYYPAGCRFTESSVRYVGRKGLAIISASVDESEAGER